METTDVSFSATHDDVKAVGDNTVQLCGEEFGPTFTLCPDEILNFCICYNFDIAIVPDTYVITTQFQPGT